MEPPARDSLRWIDQRWGEIDKIFPSFTMDWIYQKDAADRLKHHRWMLTRPTFLTAARDIHRALSVDSDFIISAVTTPDARFKFPGGMQRELAFSLFRRLQKRDGADVAMFLVATACELVGLTPLNAFQEPALKAWKAAALKEECTGYGNVYVLLVHVITQTMLWVLGCLPYNALQQQATPIAISFVGDGQHRHAEQRSDDEHRLLLRQYTLSLYEKLKQLSPHPPTGRTYHESEVH